MLCFANKMLEYLVVPALFPNLEDTVFSAVSKDRPDTTEQIEYNFALDNSMLEK